MQFVDVVVGGQYGSEAKGHVTAQLVRQARLGALAQGVDDVKVINVRVAGPNAGHTVYDEAGNKFAFRTIPVAAVIDPEAILYIAPGSEIDMEVLYSEYNLAERMGHSMTGRLFISEQATVIDPEHKATEAELVGKIGSTGKGIGAARAARLMRQAATMGERYGDRDGWIWQWAEPEDLYATDEIAHNQNIHIVVEGTQGYGLSLRASGNYPYVTSSDARAIDFLAMAGIDPLRHMVKTQTWIVARVHPIRVAGNSGEIKGETSWEALGLDEEYTTVTQKVRRVGEFDVDLLRRAVQANGGHTANVVITMVDQEVPALKELQGITQSMDEDLLQSPIIDEAVTWLNENVTKHDIGARVTAFTFSPVDIIFLNGPTVDIEGDLLEGILAGVFGGGDEEDFDAESEVR